MVSDEKVDTTTSVPMDSQTLDRASGETTKAGTPEPPAYDDEKAKEAGVDTTTNSVQPDLEEQNVPAEPEFERTITGWKWALVVLAILSSTFLFALDNTVVRIDRHEYIQTCINSHLGGQHLRTHHCRI